MKKKVMNEQLNKAAKKGWRFAADAGNHRRRCRLYRHKAHSSGVFVAFYRHLGAVIGKNERKVKPMEGNEGRLAQAWVECHRRVTFFFGLILAF